MASQRSFLDQTLQSTLNRKLCKKTGQSKYAEDSQLALHIVESLMTHTPQKALLLFSGGQDSATCLAHALATYDHVETVGFDYNQRHGVELTARNQVREAVREAFPDWSEKLGRDHMLTLTALARISDTALTSDVEITMQENGLPNTFVPGRNLLFVTLAATLAYRRGQSVLVGGMCETDFSGYPDCRADTLTAQMQAINLGMEAGFTLDTPLMHLTKGESWAFAEKLGGKSLIDIILEHSHTCYLGNREVRHDWGYGCGTCPACELRAKGWADYTNVAG